MIIYSPITCLPEPDPSFLSAASLSEMSVLSGLCQFPPLGQPTSASSPSPHTSDFLS